MAKRKKTTGKTKAKRKKTRAKASTRKKTTTVQSSGQVAELSNRRPPSRWSHLHSRDLVQANIPTSQKHQTY